MNILRRVSNIVGRHSILLAAISINLLICYSVLQTHWLDIFFSGSSLHLCCQGMDFYQIPNGYLFFRHGGSLAGYGVVGLQPYSAGSYVNINVYHPFLTVILGSFFMLFQPETAFYIWMGIKCAGTLLLAGYFYWRFRKTKYIQLSMFLLLANVPQYLDLRISQYHFLFNMFTLLCLMDIVSGKKSLWSGLWYGLSILVKPLSLLWLPLLIWKKQDHIALGAVWVIIATTLPFVWGHHSDYYFANIITRLQHPITEGPIQIMTLDALLRYTISSPGNVLFLLKIVGITGIMILSFYRKTPLLTGIYGLVVMYILFFDLIYEYYYSTIAIVLAVCMIGINSFQRPWSYWMSLWVCAPSCLFLLRLWDIHFIARQLNPTVDGWKWIVIGRIIPIILLTGFAFSASIKQALLSLFKFYQQNSIADSPSQLSDEDQPEVKVETEVQTDAEAKTETEVKAEIAK